MYLADMRDSEKIWRMFKETPPEDIMYIVTPSDMAESDITFVPASCGPAMVRWLGANRIRAVAGRTVRPVGHRLNPPASIRWRKTRTSCRAGVADREQFRSDLAAPLGGHPRRCAGGCKGKWASAVLILSAAARS